MHVTFLLYDGVEPIDLAALGVISMAKRVIPDVSYETVAVTRAPVRFSNGLTVLPDRSIGEVHSIDVLLVPGGPGWRAASEDPAILGFIRRAAPSAVLSSVCTGAMILAEAGVLDGLDVTTKSEVVPPERSPLIELTDRFPKVRARSALVIDTGAVVTGGGVTLCIDTMLHLLERRYDADAVGEVARIMEYSAARMANRRRFSGGAANG